MVARVLLLWLTFPHRRATIKALPTHPNRPRPYGASNPVSFG
jgi:hypothetical protein